jgi:mono/diheme cytochrome c family protein
MKTNLLILTIACAGVFFGTSGLSRKLWAKNPPTPATASAGSAAPSAEVSAARGRHLIQVSGCNDCHTPRFMELGEKVPESDWLTGVALGWRGPWGTSYPANLRRQLAAWTNADEWIKMVRSRNGLPPMPWPSLHAMTDDELRSLHAYIRSLPVTGETMPAPVTPDKEPLTPYLNLAPVMPAAKQ